MDTKYKPQTATEAAILHRYKFSKVLGKERNKVIEESKKALRRLMNSGIKGGYININPKDIKGDYPYTVDINQIKEGGGKKMVAYPRLYISAQTHERIRKIALKNKTDMKKIGDKIARAGIKALGM